MDPFSIAAAAVTALASFFGRQANRAADHAGDAIADRLFGLIEEHLSRGPAARAVLNGFVADPSNSALQDRLGSLVGQLAASDPAFAEELARAVDATEPGVRIDHAGAVSLGGNVNLQGHNVAGRDQYITNPPE